MVLDKAESNYRRNEIDGPNNQQFQHNSCDSQWIRQPDFQPDVDAGIVQDGYPGIRQEYISLEYSGFTNLVHDQT